MNGPLATSLLNCGNRADMNASTSRAGLCLVWVALVAIHFSGSASASDAARRIVSLAPSVTETVAALGAVDRLAGVSAYCDYPPEVRKIDRVGTFLSPAVESIVAKRPDVVLAVPSPANRNPVESLRELGVHVVVVKAETIADIKESILTIGREIGRDEAAQALVLQIERRMAGVCARVADAPRRKVLMVIGHTPLHGVGAGTFLHELIEMAGGTNLGAQPGGSWPQLSLEFAITAQPEVIIDTTMGDAASRRAVAATEFWEEFRTIPAVRERRVYGQIGYHVLRPGPRIAEALETLARCIHPERFSRDPDLPTSRSAQAGTIPMEENGGGREGIGTSPEGATQ